MPTYTPGPWLTSDKIWIRAVSGVRIASIDYSSMYDHRGRTDEADAELDANALVIAAAPELLEALRTIVEKVDSLELASEIADGFRFHNARAAIAKAEGRS